jgi:iron complex outermembrane receptor protein
VFVDDINTDSAPSYTVFNLRAVLQQEVQKWRFSEYVRVENLFDKDYIGSVRVNDSNSRFFEAAPGRNYLMGVNATYRF